jgi:hypothetical protein
MRKLIRIIRENSLTIVLFTAFLICISAASFAGWRSHNDNLAAHRLIPLGYCHYLATGTFLEGLASNWQAAFLQLGSLIVLSKYLYQRGDPHSIDPHKPKRKHNRQKRTFPLNWIYRNSLSLAFISLFMLSFILFAFSGAGANNEERALVGQPPISVMAFLLSAKFWWITLQTWEAEYLVITLYVVLTVFLRQEGSPESKPVESSNERTGEENK